MKNKQFLKLLLGIFIMPTIGFSQIVNSGQMVVSPGTILSTAGDFDNKASGSFFNDGDVYVYANWNNDGLVSFFGNTGLTRYVGSSVQNISGSALGYLYNSYFSNKAAQPAYTLSGGISIANLADFNYGILDNSNFPGTFQFENNGKHISTSSTSHVDGTVTKVGNKSFVYPLGDKGFYRMAGISGPSMLTDVFSSKYFFENPNTSYPIASKAGVISSIDDKEYWSITRNTGTSNVFVTLSWDETTTTPAAIVAAPQTAMHIVRWDATQKLWVDEGGVADVANKTITTLVAPDNYGIFTLARVKEDLVLPGNVVVYNGISPNGDGVNDYFVLDNIQSLANNKVQVFNRWGVEVFQTDNYDTNGNVFKGYSDGRITVDSGNQLPTGTYYYILSYDYTANGTTQRIKKSGYLYLTSEN